MHPHRINKSNFLTLVLVLCRASAEPVYVYYGTSDSHEFDFAQKHVGNDTTLRRVNIATKPGGSEMIQVKIRYGQPISNEPLDVLTADSSEIYHLGMLAANLYEYFDKADLQARFSAEALKAFEIGDKLIGIPYMSDIYVMYYNKHLLAKYNQSVPQTLDELEATARTIMEKERQEQGRENFWGLFFAADSSRHMADLGMILMESMGASFFKDGKVTIRSEEAKIAVERIKGWMGLNGISPLDLASQSNQDVAAEFSQGNAVFLFDKLSIYSEGIQTYISEDTNAFQCVASNFSTKAGVAPIPGVLPGVKSTVKSWRGFVMNAQSKDKEASVNVIKALTSKDVQLIRSQRGDPPTLKSLLNDPATCDDSKPTHCSIDSSSFTPVDTNFDKFGKHFYQFDLNMMTCPVLGSGYYVVIWSGLNKYFVGGYEIKEDPGHGRRVQSASATTDDLLNEWYCEIYFILNDKYPSDSFCPQEPMPWWIIPVSILGVIALFGLIYCLYRFVKYVQSGRRAMFEREAAAESEVMVAWDSLNTLRFLMVLISYNDFKRGGKIISFEDARKNGMLTYLDTHQEAKQFCEDNPVVFISHQWLAPSDPDLRGVQYRSIVRALSKIAEDEQEDVEAMYIWIDYTSIPQSNDVLKAMSIDTISLYACLPSYFVVISPHTTNEKGDKVNKTTYLERGWCRLEQWARFSRWGMHNMYIVEDEACDSNLRRLSTGEEVGKSASRSFMFGSSPTPHSLKGDTSGSSGDNLGAPLEHSDVFAARHSTGTLPFIAAGSFECAKQDPIDEERPVYHQSVSQPDLDEACTKGKSDMFYAKRFSQIRSTQSNLLLQADPMLSTQQWVENSVCVFEGKFTDDADRFKLKSVIAALWIKSCCIHTEDDYIHDFVCKNKDRVFPKKYFGNMIEIAERVARKLRISRPSDVNAMHMPPPSSRTTSTIE